LSQTSLYLHAFRDSYADSKYGAIWFTHDQFSMVNGTLYNETVVQQCQLANSAITYPRDCRRFGGVGYVIQFNFTAPHAAIMYETIANEALARHASDNPDLKVETTIAPLPITAVESSLGAGEDAFTVWFLVSKNCFDGEILSGPILILLVLTPASDCFGTDRVRISIYCWCICILCK